MTYSAKKEVRTTKSLAVIDFTLRNEARARGVERLAVSIVLHTPQGILLLRRAAHDRFGGTYDLPGGGVQPTETLLKTARRELMEETGLELSGVEHLHCGFDCCDSAGRALRYFFAHVRLPHTPHAHIRMNPAEHDHFVFFKHYAELEAYPLSRDLRSAVRRVCF